MTEPNANRGRHPLLADGERERLETIVDVMYQVILKRLGHPPGTVKRVGHAPATDHERVLVGGVSADDVLQESLIALLGYDPSKLKETWERLAVRIARNKAVDAIRGATRGRKDPTTGAEIEIVPLDRALRARGNAEGPRPIELLPGGMDPEAEFTAIHQELVLRDLAREHLDDRGRRIFFEIHYGGRSRAQVGRELGLTGARVGQLYAEITQRLDELAQADPLFSASWERETDETRTDETREEDDT